MTRKTQYLILILAIAGLGIFLWRDKADQIHYQLPTINQVPGSKISKITVRRDQETIVLRKDAGSWTLPPRGYPAHRGRVTRMLRAVGDLQLSALVSQSKHYERYGLDQKQAIQVTARDRQDRILRRFEVGKTASTSQGTYVRLTDDPNVYLTQSNLRSALDVDASSLQDKQVLSFVPDRIHKIDLQLAGDPGISLHTTPEQGKTKDKNQDQPGPTQVRWVTAQDTTVNATAANSLIRQLSSLRCARYIEDKDKEDLRAPHLRVTLHGKSTHDLRLFSLPGNTSGETAGTSSDNAFPFILSSPAAKQIQERVHKLVP
jgi:hypothetical protein